MTQTSAPLSPTWPSEKKELIDFFNDDNMFEFA